MKYLTQWFQYRWNFKNDRRQLLSDYRDTFGSPAGQRVLAHMLDSIYCTVDQSGDPIRALVHNARRSVVQEILENLDLAENSEKYRVMVEASNGVA